MADKPKTHDAPAVDDAQGAGTSAEPSQEAVTSDTNVASDTKDAQIAALQAQLAAAQASATLSQIQAAQAPVQPVSFAAPSAPLIGKLDSVTGLVQNLPQMLWDKLSDEDQTRFSEMVPQPADK
jgi:hypothetical protein